MDVRGGGQISLEELLSDSGARWAQLAKLYTQVDSQIERALHRECSIGLSEFLALAACSVAPHGEMRMHELSEAVDLNQSSVTRLVARLERSGLTERRMCEHDRRGVYTGITQHGHTILSRAIPAYEQAVAQTLSRLSGDERVAEFIKMIQPSAAT